MWREREKKCPPSPCLPRRGSGAVPFSFRAWREELGSSGLMGELTYQAKRLHFHAGAKMTSSWGNLHFHNAAESLIVPQWARVVTVLPKSNYNAA